MGYRKWDSETKFLIVLEGLKKESNLAELCNQNQISQSQYYKWRDEFLSKGKKIFELGKEDKEQERLTRANRRLTSLIGKLTIELKKNEYDE